MFHDARESENVDWCVSVVACIPVKASALFFPRHCTLLLSISLVVQILKNPLCLSSRAARLITGVSTNENKLPPAAYVADFWIDLFTTAPCTDSHKSLGVWHWQSVPLMGMFY